MQFKLTVLGMEKFKSLFEGYVAELGEASETAAYEGAKIIADAATDSFRTQGPVIGSHYNKKLKQEVTDYGDPGEPIPDKLTSRSGILRESINAQRAGPGRAVVASNVPYAAIHEFGGTTQPHIIKPKYKKWLSWVGDDGVRVFAKVVHHPAVTSRLALISVQRQQRRRKKSTTKCRKSCCANSSERRNDHDRNRPD